MGAAENEKLILAMWEDYDREGLPGILRWAADDARWRPHSAGGRVFLGTQEYRAEVERAQAAGVRVESVRLGMWSRGDAVVVRGLLTEASLDRKLAQQAFIALHGEAA